KASFQRTTREIEDDLVILQPLRGDRSVGGTAGDIVGVAQITFALHLFEASARAAALRLLAISLGSYVVLSVVLGLVLRVLVTKPVRMLATVAQRFRHGNRAHRSGIQRSDEIGVLSAAFDDMANEVERSLEQVATRNRDLEEQRAALERALNDLQASAAARL